METCIILHRYHRSLGRSTICYYSGTHTFLGQKGYGTSQCSVTLPEVGPCIYFSFEDGTNSTKQITTLLLKVMSITYIGFPILQDTTLVESATCRKAPISCNILEPVQRIRTLGVVKVVSYIGYLDMEGFPTPP